MLRLDHCVIHIDPDGPQLETFRQHAAEQGIPFDPSRGKGTAGFQTADLFVGEQYWELVWLKQPDGGGWRPEWVARYNAGHRGVICLMLLTDQLDHLRTAWLKQGVHLSEPERIHFSFLGVLRKTLPWRNLYLEPIPGTELQLGLQEMDSERALRQMPLHLTPNAAAHGISGFQRIILRHAFDADAWSFLQRVFPQAVHDDNRLQVALDDPMELRFERTADTNQALQVIVQASTVNDASMGGSLAIENICLQTLRSE